MTKQMEKSDLGTRLYAQLASKPGNLFLSGYSVDVALGMCKAGAKGETNKVLGILLGAPEDQAEANRHYKALVRGVNGDGGERPYELITANALWVDKDYKYHDTYKKAVRENFGGNLIAVDFRKDPDDAVVEINSWASNNTKGKIPELIKRDFINSLTKLILTNAIYFKGKWKREFRRALTNPGTFYTAGGPVQAPLMADNRSYNYFEGDGFQSLDMPYQGDDLSLLVVLPKEQDGLGVLEKTWAAEGTYHPFMEGLHYEESVQVTLPRFKMSTEFRLGDTLKDMGAALCFSDKADFTGIGVESLKISEVIHKGFVEVNEEGTEAAAATAVGMMKCTSVREPKPVPVFRADHPFMFFIRNQKTGTVLFSGRVTDPR